MIYKPGGTSRPRICLEWVPAAQVSCDILRPEASNTFISRVSLSDWEEFTLSVLRLDCDNQKSPVPLTVAGIPVGHKLTDITVDEESTPPGPYTYRWTVKLPVVGKQTSVPVKVGIETVAPGATQRILSIVPVLVLLNVRQLPSQTEAAVVERPATGAEGGGGAILRIRLFKPSKIYTLPR